MRLYASFALATFAALSAAGTATFDDLSFSTATPTYENGRYLNGAPSFTSGGVAFKNAYDPTYDSWEGFAYSKQRDATSAGLDGQYAAYSGAAFSGTSYGVSFGDGATISLPTGQRILGMEVTNTTYAALAILNGDPYNISKPFATGSFFALTATGYANGLATGSASFNLADYRFADPSKDYVVKDWTYFDLSGLGTATSVVFSYASSDVGQYGINTPTYFALDDVRTQAVPEPTTLAVLGLGVSALVRRRKGGAK